jgi:hypothetical protein
MSRRGTGLAVLLATACAAVSTGCESDPPPAELPPVAPSPARTPGTGTPVPSPTAAAQPSGTTVAPTGTGTAAPPLPADDLIGYQELRAGWQEARLRFFTAVSDGRPRTIAQQRALAAAYLTGLRRFAAGVRDASAGWPEATRPAVRELLAANAAQQVPVADMARAAGATAFADRLADYGVGVARENRAVDAVERALGG